MRTTPSLTHLEFIPLLIKTPYHAPHLFSENDIKFVLSTTLAYQFVTQSTVIPVISGATGEYIWTEEFRSLLRAATEDILRQQFRWEKVSHRLKLIASSARRMPVIIHQIGSTTGGAVRTTLGESGCESALVLDQSPFLSQSCSVHSESTLSPPLMGDQISLKSLLSAHREDFQVLKTYPHSGTYSAKAAMSMQWCHRHAGMLEHM